jgi:hypothetical protein
MGVAACGDMHVSNFGVFASRLLPVVRTFISLPAGVAKCGTSHGNFCTYSDLPSGNSIAMSSSQLFTSTMRATSTSPIFQCLMFSLAMSVS